MHILQPLRLHLMIDFNEQLLHFDMGNIDKAYRTPYARETETRHSWPQPILKTKVYGSLWNLRSRLYSQF